MPVPASTTVVGGDEGAMAPNAFVDEELARLRAADYGGAAAAEFARAFWSRARETGRRRPELVRELRVVRRVGVVVALLIGLAIHAEGVPAVPAVAWPMVAWVVLCGWVAVELGLVRHPLSGVDAPRIGPANVMTLYRGWVSVPIVLVASARPGPTLAWVVLCITAGLTDLFDGTVALRLGHESRLGRLIDPVLDAFFFSAAAFSLARWGLLPGWMAAVVAARYFAPVIGGLVLLFVVGHTMPVRHTPWGQRATMATAFALSVSWVGTLVRLPALLLPGLYAVAVGCMALALLGILRRAPGAAAGSAGQ
ncbi:MAG: CDP-alcohol phosphatidyltransferase family protein [Candidatus Dormibacteria bacterium]